MAIITVGILAADDEQLDLLQALVDATTTGRTVMKELATSAEEISRKIKEARPQVLLMDVPPRSAAAALSTIEEGSTEFMCHPGYLGAELQNAPTRLKGSRVRELEALISPRIRQAMSEAEIELASFRTLDGYPESVSEKGR